MLFYTKKRRSPTLTILPLLDILAILLIFFIVTTTFKKNLPQLQINLPESKTAQPQASEQQEPLVLRVLDAENIALGEQELTLDTLAAAIQEQLVVTPDRVLALQADRSAEFGVVIQVLDILKEAGIKNIPAFMQPAEESATPSQP
ncbi:MAG: ExbD/TolR family protein [Chthoniobacterales bacterium]